MEEMENAPCGSMTFSLAGTIQTINTTLLDLLQYGDKSELIGKNAEVIFTMAGRIFYQTHFFPLLRLHGRANEIFFSLQTKDKKSLPVICNAVKREINNEVAFHCIFIAVAERAKYEQEILAAKQAAEKELEQNEQMISVKKYLEQQSIDLDKRVSSLRNINNDITQFGTIISHDLQESIRRISVLTDKVVRGSKQLLSEKKLNHLERVNDECTKLRNLVTNLERYITLNIQPEHLVAVDINAVVQSAYSKALLNTKTDNVNFLVETLPVIDGSKSQLELLFYNLLENCLKFQDHQRPLTIKIGSTITQQNIFLSIKDKYRYSDFLKITIADNGIGFDSKEHTFDLLQKQGESIGFGFGLAFCKKIAENHFGSINASSEKGVGTTIDVVLPFKQS